MSEPHQSDRPPSSSNSTRDSNRELLAVLSASSSPRPALPPELILQCLSDPSRWVVAWSENIDSPIVVRTTDGARVSRVLLRTPPLTARSANLIRKIVFTFRSQDQGWSSYPQHHGTFEHSWTWFDAAVVNRSTDSVQAAGDDTNCLDALLDSPNIRRHLIQYNRHGIGTAEQYTITMYPGQEIFADLEVGDQILLVACTRFPGWENHIEDAGIEIWEQDDLDE